MDKNSSTQATPPSDSEGKQAGPRKGPYDPKPGAAVKGKGNPSTAPTGQATTHTRRAERRPELIKQRRQQLRASPKKRDRERLYWRIGLGALAAVLVVGVVWTAVAWARDRDLNQEPDGVQVYNYTSNDHQAGELTWPETPPVGGAHNDVWQNCGFYDKPIRNEHAVHSLEHGAVWITYRPDLPRDQIDQLRKFTDDYDYALVSAYPDLPAPIVGTSWNHQKQFQSADDKELKRFVRYFHGKRNSIEFAPEPGAACTNGTSETSDVP